MSRARSTRAAPLVAAALSACVLAVPSLAATASAQPPASPASTGRITGTVTDSASGRPLSAVQVNVAGTRFGAATDETGRYTIGGVPAGTVTVEARRLGYRPTSRAAVRVAAGEATDVPLRLGTAPLTLEAVVTTGVVDPTSGTRVPFTVGRVDAENAPVPATNAVETIQGKIAGVTVVPSGQPGSGTNIQLRSPTSINKSISPLIVVDGVILSQSFSGSTADLESMDIESMEVVKGAAAASLYGSRASSGVISIRTRRGSNVTDGATRVTARSEFGSNQLGGNMTWAQNHFYLTNAQGQYVDAAGNVVDRARRVAKPVYTRFQDGVYPGQVFDQVDRFFNPGNTYRSSVNVAQNGGKTNWFLSYVNSKEDGVVLNTGRYDQNDIRLNLDHRPVDNVRLSFSGYHSRSNRQELYGDTFFDLINQAPDVDLRAPDPDGTPYLFQGDVTEGREENPLYVLATEQRRRKRARTQGSVEARYTPLGWLTIDGNISYDRSDRLNTFFLDQGVKTEGFALGGPGEITQTNGTTDALNAAASANFLQKFGALTLRSTLRALQEREDNNVVTANGTFLAVPGVRSLENATQRFFPTSTLEQIRTDSYFGSLAADYRGRYILDGLVRRDGSSLFGPEERWNTYYRASGAWRVAEEKWFPIDGFSELKLRLSQGTAGGRPDFDDQFETLQFTTGGGLRKVNLGNKFLKPELARETEVGLDAIWHERYSLQLSYARSHVTDQLLQVPLAGFYGYTTQWRNAGTVDGNTVEGTFEAQVLRSPKLAWRVGLVADRSRNRISQLDVPCYTTQTIAYRCAGTTLGAMYGFRFITGVNELPQDVQARASEFQVNDEGLLVYVGPGNTFKEGETKRLWGSPAVTIGTSTYQFGIPITQRDAAGNAALVQIGDGNPDFHVGLSNNVTWRDFSFFGLVDVVKGGNVYNQTNQRMYQYGRSADVDQAGKEQELKKPVDYYVALYAANSPTDYFVEDGGFVKLRELSVRYNVGRRFAGPLSRVGARGLSLSLIGRNLVTFTNYKGYDPEVSDSNRPTVIKLDSFGYPRYRTITGSVQVEF